MATEFKLNYSGSEINRRLADVDTIKNNLKNDYYTSAEIDIKFTENDGKFDEVNENINTKIGEVNSSLNLKADLIEGKVPSEQIPDDIVDLSGYYTKEESDASFAFKADLVDGKVPLEQLPDNIGGGVASWNDLEDKPFGVEDVILTLPEDTSNCTTVASYPLEALGGLSLSATKASENYFNSPDETFGAEIGLTANGSSMDFVVVNSDIVEFDNGFMAQRLDGGWYPLYINITSAGTATIDTTNMLGENLIFDFAETGLYFLNTEGLITTDYFKYKNIKKIDEKFLPGSASGGVSSWNDLTDRPFYEGVMLIEPPSNISEAIAISSQPLEDMGGMSFIFVRGGDAFNTPEETYDGLIKLNYGGEVLDFIINDSYLNALNNGFALIDLSSGFFPLVVNVNSSGTTILPAADMFGEDMVFEVTEPGAYFLNIEGMANVISYSNAVIKQLDDKFIPDNILRTDGSGGLVLSWNNIENKPINTANGVAGLNENGKISNEQLSVAYSVSEYVNDPVSSNAVYNALSSKQDKITIDSSVVLDSNNPVSSNAVYNALQNKQDVLTIDSYVNSNSDNLVTSKGIYTAIQNTVYDAVKNIDLSEKQDRITVSTKDNGKFMRVVNGSWAAVTVPNAEEALF